MIMAKNNKINTEAYTGNYSDESFKDKVKRVGQKMGGKLLFNAFILYYVLKSRNVPITVKLEIMGALGYVIFPADVIPDFVPVAGFSDDMMAIAYAIDRTRAYITPEIRRKAEQRVLDIIGSTSECTLAA